jgi:hypothetical protein
MAAEAHFRGRGIGQTEVSRYPLPAFFAQYSVGAVVFVAF